MKFLIIYLFICLFLQFGFFPYLEKVENFQNEKMELLRASYDYITDEQF
jgi:hypothetical protein